VKAVKAVTISIDKWDGLSCSEEIVDSPRLSDVERLVTLLDASTRTIMTLDAGAEQHMAIGGGGGRYIVYTQEQNGDLFNLISPTATDGIVMLNAGGQEGDYPARQIIDFKTTLQAAAFYFEHAHRDERLHWERG
jgi:hypothetical protein